MRWLALLLVALLPSLVRAQAKASVPDPDPELERQSFIVADGFEVNLFAGDPMLAKPIQMNFDAKGRLWVASSATYPHIKPGQVANDQILILEDTNHDGKADKVTVFADKLLIPTGLEPGNGGVYVANSTELLHLSENKQTGKLDRSTVVLSGFGTEDTHHLLHTLRWMPDGCLAMNQSVYIHSHIETAFGTKRLNGGGVWRYQPRTGELNVFVRGFWNTWGHHADPFGQSFITDGAGGEGIAHGVPGAAYPAAVGEARLLHGLNPGSPKYCGLEIMSGRHLPDDWQGNLITNDFRGHRVCRFVISEDGSTYSSREKTELIKSKHGAFRPIDIKMGPDGAIYVADWYNPIIQHGEVDFRDPRRDHVHGRIWRITAKGRPTVPVQNLTDAKLPELLTALLAPEEFTRRMARRTLAERPTLEVVPAVLAWAKSQSSESAKLEALWVTAAHGPVDPMLLEELLSAKDGRIRAAAVRLLTGPTARTRLPALIRDPHPRVRLEAVIALRSQPGIEAAMTAVLALNMPMDKVLDDALARTLRETQAEWLPAFRAGKLDFGGNAAHLTYALQAVGSKDTVGPLVNLLKSGTIPADRQEPIWAIVAALGGASEINALFAQAKLTRSQALFSLLEEAAVRGVKPTESPESVKTFFTDAKLAPTAMRLAGLWKQSALGSDLRSIAESPTELTIRRSAALAGLTALKGVGAKADLDALTDAKQPPETRRLATIALAEIDTPAAAKLAAELLNVPPTEATDELYRSLLARKNGANVLAAALDGKTLPSEQALAGIRLARDSVQDVTRLTETLRKAGKLEATRQLTQEQMQQFLTDMRTVGNAARGEAIYRRKDMACARCHALSGAGGLVGPDMGSIGASAQADYILESLLMPNKAVKEGYHSLKIDTLDGKTFSGIKVRETANQLVLRTADDKELIIPVKNIEERAESRSLMPDGLTDTLSRAELLDLTRFLSELGKVGPYAPASARIVRTWQTFQSTPQTMQRLRQTGLAGVAEDDPDFLWQPSYALVSGMMPLAELPSMVVFNGPAQLSIVRTQLEATTGGAITLQFNDIAGMRLYLDGKPIEPALSTPITLQSGLHRVVIVIDRSVRTTDLKMELGDVMGSPARVNVAVAK